ncbi:taste receptor type 2 member 40-like [Latimeria chalumnae]|uniref:taste receptor type 2 member 40-like n=1 Tax=Latimeria chalumnae TaxID=7897 RepID=UPI00313B0799
MGAAAILQMFATMILLGIGCFGNSFIMLVFLVEYKRSWTLQAHELIVTLIVVANIVNELIYVFHFAIHFFNLCFYNGETIFALLSLLEGLIPKVISWLTAWLCFVYCVKIIKVNWRFFMRVKQRISLAVKVMIIGTIGLCCLISVPIYFMIHLKGNTTKGCRDFYVKVSEKELSVLYGGTLTFFTSFLPLLLMLVSSVSIVIFLCQHSRNMDKNMASSSSSHNEAHTSVAIIASVCPCHSLSSSIYNPQQQQQPPAAASTTPSSSSSSSPQQQQVQQQQPSIYTMTE